MRLGRKPEAVAEIPFEDTGRAHFAAVLRFREGGQESGRDWSARRPAQPASANQVHMQMKHALTRFRAHIEHRAIAIFNATFPRKLGRDHMAVAHLGGIIGRSFLQSTNVPLGDNENMGWRLRVDVLEGKRAIVFVDLLGLRLTFDNSAE